MSYPKLDSLMRLPGAEVKEFSMQKSFTEQLQQVDLNNCSPDRLNNMPPVFVPIRGEKLSGAEIKYLVHRCGRHGADLCFRLQAVRDFETREGRAVRAGEWGGVIDNRSFIPHKDLSWAEADCFLFNSRLEKDSLLKSNSRVEDSRICSSLVEQSLIVNGRLSASTVRNSEVLEYCTLEKADVDNCRLADRVWLEDVKARNAQLLFVAADNSVISFEKLKGDVANVDQLRLHGYHSPEKGMQKSEVPEKHNFWQWLRRRGRE